MEVGSRQDESTSIFLNLVGVNFHFFLNFHFFQPGVCLQALKQDTWGSTNHLGGLADPQPGIGIGIVIGLFENDTHLVLG